MVGPLALRCSVVSGANAGEGAEIIDEVRLIIVAAGEGEFGPVNVGAVVHMLNSLLEPLDAAVEFG